MVGHRAGDRIRAGRPVRSAPLQCAPAEAALVDRGVPGGHAVHGFRQPLQPEHDRMVPRLAAHRRRPGGRLDDGSRRPRKGWSLPRPHRFGVPGRDLHRSRDVGLSAWRLRCSLSRVALPDAQNFAGCLLGVAAALAYARPTWMGWPKPWSLAAFWICVVGILATQSRQSLVALALVLIVLVLKRDPHRRRSKVILVTVVPASRSSAPGSRPAGVGNQFNSANRRLNWFEDSWWSGVSSPGWEPLAMVVHRPVPVRLPASQRRDGGPQQPGVIGLAAFLVLMLGALVVLWKMDPVYGTAAFAVWAADSCRASWTCSGWRRRPPSRSSSSASASARKRSTPANPTTPRPPRPIRPLQPSG